MTDVDERCRQFGSNARTVNLVRHHARSEMAPFYSLVVVYADAPHILLPADLPQNLGTIGAAGTAPVEVGSSDPEVIPRGWWKRGDPETMQRCIEFLGDLLHQQEQPFDVSYLVHILLSQCFEELQGVLGFR